MEKKYALLRLDHKEAVIYQLGGAEEKEVKAEIPNDPNKKRVHLHKKNIFTWKGQRAPEDYTYFKEIIKDLRGFDGFVIASHGTGKSNEGENFVKYLKEHHHNDMAQKILEVIKSDEHDTENQLLAKVDHDLLLTHLHR